MLPESYDDDPEATNWEPLGLEKEDPEAVDPENYTRPDPDEFPEGPAKDYPDEDGELD